MNYENRYVDRYGFYHDAPVVDGLPSSDNAFIYTAYADLLGLPINWTSIIERTNRCYKTNHSMTVFSMDRVGHSGRPKVPISKDEIIGLASLGLLHYESLKHSHFLFYRDQFQDHEVKPTFLGYLKAIVALYKIRKEHYTEVWKGRHTDAYTLAFRLPAVDRYFVKRMYREKPSLFETLVFHLSVLHTAFFGKFYSKTITYLMLKKLNKTKHLAFLLLESDKDLFKKEFAEDHPIRRKFYGES